VTSTRSRPADPSVRYGVRMVDPPDLHLELERIGQTYVVNVEPLGAEFVFRDVRVDRNPTADVTLRSRGLHLFRTGEMTLTSTSRARLAKDAFEFSSASDLMTWRRAVGAAVERVMEAEEALGGGIDLRRAALPKGGSIFIAGKFLVSGPNLLVMPAEGGKSTMARALAVSMATGREVVPSIVPRVTGPVLYVAAEAGVAAMHARSVEAICRGIGISRTDIDHPITMLRTLGRPLNKIARSIGERGHDHALIVLDSLQALLPVSEHAGGIRDRDTVFWNALEQIDRPTLVIAHPNREDAKRWARSDGRSAGSDTTRDRTRISWKGWWRDEDAVSGTTYRRYTLECRKFNDGPRPTSFGVGVTWQLGVADDDPGTVYFTEVEPERSRSADPSAAAPVPASADEPEEDARTEADLGPVMRETLEAWRAGARTPGALAARVKGLTGNTAKKRLDRLKVWLADHSDGEQIGAFGGGT
jgi:hypothetical protein